MQAANWINAPHEKEWIKLKPWMLALHQDHALYLTSSKTSCESHVSFLCFQIPHTTYARIDHQTSLPSSLRVDPTSPTYDLE